MTPEEAKTKWCPFVRMDLGHRPGTGWNRNGGTTECLGPDCMAWRIDREYSGDHGGYCGLAGKDGAP